jgi:polyferredoxin
MLILLLLLLIWALRATESMLLLVRVWMGMQIPQVLMMMRMGRRLLMLLKKKKKTCKLPITNKKQLRKHPAA